MGGPRAFNSSESASNSGGLFYTIGKIFGGGSRRRGGSRRGGSRRGGSRRGGAKTRAMRRASLSRRRSYRRRVKSSACRGKGPAVCRSMDACKYSSGKKRSFCRKSKNTRRRRGGSRRGGSRRGGSRRGGSRRGGSRR